MELVYKYPIHITAYQVIFLPRGARIIHAGVDGEKNPSVWAQVNPSEEKQDVKIWIIDTGSPIPEEAQQHVGTFLYDNRAIKHVYI